MTVRSQFWRGCMSETPNARLSTPRVAAIEHWALNDPERFRHYARHIKYFTLLETSDRDNVGRPLIKLPFEIDARMRDNDLWGVVRAPYVHIFDQSCHGDRPIIDFIDQSSIVMLTTGGDHFPEFQPDFMESITSLCTSLQGINGIVPEGTLPHQLRRIVGNIKDLRVFELTFHTYATPDNKLVEHLLKQSNLLLLTLSLGNLWDRLDSEPILDLLGRLHQRGPLLPQIRLLNLDLVNNTLARSVLGCIDRSLECLHLSIYLTAEHQPQLTEWFICPPGSCDRLIEAVIDCVLEELRIDWLEPLLAFAKRSPLMRYFKLSLPPADIQVPCTKLREMFRSWPHLEVFDMPVMTDHDAPSHLPQSTEFFQQIPVWCPRIQELLTGLYVNLLAPWPDSTPRFAKLKTLLARSCVNQDLISTASSPDFLAECSDLICANVQTHMPHLRKLGIYRFFDGDATLEDMLAETVTERLEQTENVQPPSYFEEYVTVRDRIIEELCEDAITRQKANSNIAR